MNTPNHIIFNYQHESSFINLDLLFLSNNYSLYKYKFDPAKKLFTPLYFIHQFFFFIKYWKKYNLIISQIAGYHTFIPSILSYLKLKKHIIILHGTDCNCIPEINYGNLQKPVLKWFTKKSIMLCNHLLPVSQSLIENNSTYYLKNKAKFGLQNNIENFNTPYTVIHNCVDDKIFTISQENRSIKSFITIALGLNLEKNVKLKGIDLVINLARQNPDFEITILGSETIFGYKNELKNVKIIGKVNHKELNHYYNLHKYYLQLSISESFGISLCEAMLCGCIPIVSNVGMMPEIIQEKNLVLNEPNIQALEKIISRNIQIGDNIQNMLNRRSLIMDRFSIEQRKTRLLNLLNTSILTSSK
jgi:glycosyltransferase involved in cell wall biosynthesis